MRTILIAALRAYKRWLSPMLPPACRYVPSCSEYAMEAVERYGVLHGSALAVWRVLRCNPFSKGGYDPLNTEYQVLSTSCHSHSHGK